jgi:ADP-dependent NAD(P)H-hydrate dehydratase
MAHPPSTGDLPQLPPRPAASHKGDFGRALFIGGSRGMSGAIALAGMASLRSGAGLVTLAVPDVCLETVAGFDPNYMTVALPCDPHGRLISSATSPLQPFIAQATCIGLGPGIGRSRDLSEFVRELYTTLPQPVVVDADGLNALATHADGLAGRNGPRIITPHPGEFRRLLKRDRLTDRDSVKCAEQIAKRHDLVVVLKGHRTLVTDGTTTTRNATGNPGMATGGSGDVLTGIITALLCQGLAPLAAARLGVHVHGLAGDLAAEELGQVSLIAHDLIRYLPKAFLRLAPSPTDAPGTL